MTTEEKKQKTAQAIAEFVASATAAGAPNLNRRVVDVPLMEGDVITFKVDENQSASDLLSIESIENSDNKYYAITDANGRKISTTSLIGRKSNGIDVNGDTTVERITAFLDMIDEKGEVSFKVAKLRVLPSTRPEFNAQRIITWAKA